MSSMLKSGVVSPCDTPRIHPGGINRDFPWGKLPSTLQTAVKIDASSETCSSRSRNLLARDSLSDGILSRACNGLRTRGSVVCQATSKVVLKSPEKDFEIEVPEDAYILATAETQGLKLPYSCRSGNCGMCAGKILEGSVDQSEGMFLEEFQMERGYVLPCISYPMSNLVIQTHQEEFIPIE